MRKNCLVDYLSLNGGFYLGRPIRSKADVEKIIWNVRYAVKEYGNFTTIRHFVESYVVKWVAFKVTTYEMPTGGIA